MLKFKKNLHVSMTEEYSDEIDSQYHLMIQWTDIDNKHPLDDIVDVHVRFNNGNEYYATFMTPRSLENQFKKNAKTGECLAGTYFCMRANPVFVSALEEKNIKRTIDDLMQNQEFDNHFRLLPKD